LCLFFPSHPVLSDDIQLVKGIENGWFTLFLNSADLQPRASHCGGYLLDSELLKLAVIPLAAVESESFL
jgi:hypothetical protein